MHFYPLELGYPFQPQGLQRLWPLIKLTSLTDKLIVVKFWEEIKHQFDNKNYLFLDMPPLKVSEPLVDTLSYCAKVNIALFLCPGILGFVLNSRNEEQLQKMTSAENGGEYFFLFFYVVSHSWFYCILPVGNLVLNNQKLRSILKRVLGSLKILSSSKESK